MSSVLIDSRYTPEPIRPSVTAALPSPQWLRQYEAELARESVCRAIRMEDAAQMASGRNTPTLLQGGAVASGQVPAPTPAANVQPVVPAARLAAPVESGQAQMIPPRAVKEAQPVYPMALLQAAEPEQVSHAVEAGAWGGRSVAVVPEAMVRAWLKPYKVTVFSEEGQVRVWLRDARLSPEQAAAVAEHLTRLVRENGGQLVLLAINGAVVKTSSSPAVSGGFDVIKRG